MSGEWIEHDGNGAPDLGPGTRVEVLIDGPDDWHAPRTWEWWHGAGPENSNWIWNEPKPDWGIIAYRVVSE